MQRIQVIGLATFSFVMTFLFFNLFAQASASLGAPPSTLGASAPILKTSKGEILTEGVSGQMSVISVYVTNGLIEPASIVAIVEVRDENGISQHIQFALVTVDPGERSEVGVSWTPREDGVYVLRTFLLSDLTSPRVLTWIEERSISVA